MCHLSQCPLSQVNFDRRDEVTPFEKKRQLSLVYNYGVYVSVNILFLILEFVITKFSLTVSKVRVYEQRNFQQSVNAVVLGRAERICGPRVSSTLC